MRHCSLETLADESEENVATKRRFRVARRLLNENSA
jgi:hypothetical protein